MKSRDLLALALIACTLAPSVSFANEEVSAEDKERAYQILCVPGAADAVADEKDRSEAKEFRVVFHQFLRNPSAIISQYQRDKSEGGFLGALGAGIMIAATCGATDILKADIEARGCTDEKGKPASIKKAIELCAPVMGDLK